MMQFYVKGQVLTVEPKVIADGTIDHLSAQVNFMTGEWAGADKWLIFSKGETQYSIHLQDDKITADRHLNLSAGEWSIYAQATKGAERITTTPTTLTVERSGMKNGEGFPFEPLEPIEQVSQTATAALTLAQDNKRRLDSGEGGGGGTGGVTREYVDAQDDEMLMDAMEYTDNQIKLVPTPDVDKAYVDKQDKATATAVDSKLTGYLKTGDISEWAKQPEKPTYTASEVGALPDSTEIPNVPSWAMEPQKPAYTAGEVGALSNDTTIPSKTSELQNDSGFITQAFGHEEGAEPTAELKANVFHKFATPAETITVTVAPAEGYAEYSFQFTTASGGGNLSIPADFAWNGGKAPTLEGNKTYQVVLFSGTAYISGGVPV